MMADEALELLALCRGRALTFEERRTRRLAQEYPLGYIMDPKFVYGSAANDDGRILTLLERTLRLFSWGPDILSDRFALVEMPICGGRCLGVFDTRADAQDAQMEHIDPENLWITRQRGV